MSEQLQEIRFQGLGVSEGIVIGQVLRMHEGTRNIYRWSIEESEVDAERTRFQEAVKTAAQQVLAIKEQAEARLGREHAYIFDAHLLLLEDQKLIGDIEHQIVSQRANAEWAVKVVGDRLLSLYSEIKDDYLRERGSDIEDVMQRLLMALSGAEPQHHKLSANAVIVSQDLLPSAVAELDLRQARAIATDTGGWTSHTAILARGVGIPAVVGLRDFYRRTKTGDSIIVDSSRGQVILHPSTETLNSYRQEANLRGLTTTEDGKLQRGPARTLDGVEVVLRANVELSAEFEGVESFGAQGVGLFRTEFLLARRGLMVSEAEQQTAYEQIAKVAGQHGAVIRLFDVAGSNSGEPTQDTEKNPALGVRAIRFGLLHEDIMRTQIRAILRAAKAGNLRIVLPMVADVSDVKRARTIIDDEVRKLNEAHQNYGEVQIGAMIEVPSAVFLADKIAAIVDFLELGTNDLVQYTLAVDRGNDEVADWFRTLHPAVLYGIDRSLKAAKKADIPSIVCGEMASTPAYAVLLVGMGATDLSMTPASIPRVRRVLTGIDSADARTIAQECLNCDSAGAVENLVREYFGRKWPDLFSAASLPAPTSNT